MSEMSRAALLLAIGLIALVAVMILGNCTLEGPIMTTAGLGYVPRCEP